MGREENKGEPGPKGKVDPAQEKTLTFDQPTGPSGKETVSNRQQAAAGTVKEKRPKVAEEPAAGKALPTVPEGTLQQDDVDKKMAQESSVIRDAPPEVPGYFLEEKLGQGTYGVVWRATEKTTNRQVAIKFFHRRVGEMWQIVWAEVKQLAMLDSVKGIVQLKDAEPDADPPYFIMNYAEGGSLSALLKKGKVPVPRALDLFREMVEAMAYVHAKGVRHCDLKPANILLDTLGKPLIADFGQAHLSLESQASSVNLGTFYYMAPEQADLTKQIPDTRWDVYGLGAIFYSMVMGEPPRASAELTGDLNNTVHLHSRLERYQEGVAKSPPPTKHRKLPAMDRSLADILEKCLRLDPAKRYQSASEILKALTQREHYLRKRPMVLMGLVASVLFILGLGGVASALVHYSVDENKKALKDRIKKDDHTTVHLVSNVVGEKLGDLKYQVEKLAANKNLYPKIKRFLEDEKAQFLLREMQKKPGENDPLLLDLYRKQETAKELEKELRRSYRKGIELLTLWDIKGHLLLGEYPIPATDLEKADKTPPNDAQKRLFSLYGDDFSYRDFFHGQGGEKKGQKYIGRSYVSEPYASSVEGSIKIAISAPIYESTDENGALKPIPGGKILGILMGTIQLKYLNSWLQDVEVSNGCVVILNHHGQFVYCTDKEIWDRWKPKAGENLVSFEQDKIKIDELDGKGTPLADYQSKVVEHKSLHSLASFARVYPQDTGVIDFSAKGAAGNSSQINPWGVMVLRYQDQVFQPIDDMRNTLFTVIGVSAVISILLLAAVWAWLLRTLRGGKGKLEPAG